MIIQINDKSVYNAAIQRVRHRDYLGALTLFAQVDSYESLLNQIGCLCALGDMSYASELYTRVWARFGKTHNVYTDLLRLGAGVGDLTVYPHNFLPYDDMERDSDKKSANKKLLCTYSRNMDDVVGSMMDYVLSNMLMFRAPSENEPQLYDVQSQQFETSLRGRLMEAVTLDTDKADAIEGQILNLDSDDVETLEMQLTLCSFERYKDHAQVIAQRVLDCPDSSVAMLNSALHIADENDNEEMAEEILERILFTCDVIPDRMLMQYLYTAVRLLDYGETTLEIADRLYNHNYELSCTALNLCARVYFNAGHMDIARDCVVILRRAVPWDCVTEALFRYIVDDIGIGIPFDTPVYRTGSFARADVPTQLADMALNYLQRATNYEQPVGDDLLHGVELISLSCCPSNMQRFPDDTESTLKRFLNFADRTNFVLSDNFKTMVKNILCGVLSCAEVKALLLWKLALAGCTDEFDILRGQHMGKCGVCKAKIKDPLFLRAACFCSVLCPPTIRTLERFYNQLHDAMESFGDVTYKQLSYAILSMNYKNFARHEASVHFNDADTKFYKFYLKTKK